MVGIVLALEVDGLKVFCRHILTLGQLEDVLLPIYDLEAAVGEPLADARLRGSREGRLIRIAVDLS